MEDDSGDRYLNKLPQRGLIFIDGSISSYCSILISTKRLEKIIEAIKLACVLSDLDSDGIREMDANKKRDTEAEENRRRKPY